MKLLCCFFFFFAASILQTRAHPCDFTSGAPSITDRYSAQDSMARRNLHSDEIVREFRDGNCWVKVQRYWDAKHNQFFTREIRDCS